MKRIPLQEAFESTFHNKYHFQELIDLDLSSECQTFEINDNFVLSPSGKLRKFSKFLNTFIFDYIGINKNVVHSYTPQKNVCSSLQIHSNNKFFLQTDITHFFQNITREHVSQIIEDQLVQSPISDLNKYKEVILNLVTHEGALPIGLPTSPNISNGSLLDFDNDLEIYCATNAIHYTRYSDDLLLSNTDLDALKPSLEYIEKLLTARYKGCFQLNHSKTKFTHSGNKVKLLGLVILPNGKITVDKKIKKQLEVLFFFFRNDKAKFKEYFNKIYGGNELQVHGQLHYIHTVDDDYLVKLRKKYGNLVVDTFFTKPNN